MESKTILFKSLIIYVLHVETILSFLEATRNFDLTLHLQAGKVVSDLFFALDRIKYKHLWPQYIPEMQELKKSYPETRREIQDGNISVAIIRVRYHLCPFAQTMPWNK